MKHGILAVSALLLALALVPAAMHAQGVTPPPAPAGQSAMGAGTSGMGAPISSELMDMKAGELAGRKLVSVSGKDLGKVDAVARNTQNGSLHAIVAVGGFLGIGETKVAVPLSQLSLQDDKLMTTLAESRRDLKDRAAIYDEQRYQALASEITIADAMTARVPPSATAPGQPPAGSAGRASFEALDVNDDGFISIQEAQGNQSLVGRWRSLDTNRDGYVDRSEFSVFEESQGMGAPMPPPVRNQDQLRQRDQLRNQDQLRQRDPTRSPSTPRPQGQSRPSASA